MYGIWTGRQDHQSDEEAILAFAKLLTFDNVGSLTYLHATLTETMRLYPPVPLVRDIWLTPIQLNWNEVTYTLQWW